MSGDGPNADLIRGLMCFALGAACLLIVVQLWITGVL